MQYWLVKTEPSVFSVDDLASSPKKTTYWDGVRNYQARNILRDQMKIGDQVFVYHSNADPTVIAGIAKVVREGYPDFTAWEKGHEHFDAGSTEANPRWYMVDLQLVRKFKHPISLETLRKTKGLEAMELLRKGSRLSVQPVKPSEFDIILKLAES